MHIHFEIFYLFNLSKRCVTYVHTTLQNIIDYAI